MALCCRALAGEELKAAQDAYERHAPPTREAWQRAHEAGTRQADVGTYGNTNALMKVDLGPGYGAVDVKNLPDHSWDIPRVAELDDAFVKLAEVPSLMPLLFKVMGPDLELMQINLRTSPGGQQPGQNRGWHRQVPRLLSHCPLAFVQRGRLRAGTWNPCRTAGRTRPSPPASRSSPTCTTLRRTAA